MFSSVLIANRGEIACRIIRTARKLGLRTIAVYSQADAGALHTRLADEAHCIGPPTAAASYLAAAKLIEIARRADARCVHPGYGFLAENADFAEACAQAGLVFVGPPPAAIRAMGLKDRAKALMERSGVPIVPGYHGEAQDADTLKREAAAVGYPVLIKAAAGGGGKGMRRVEHENEFAHALEAARREALAAFGDAKVLIEKYVSSPRHIEIQVFADRAGHCIHLNERDCSLQRRHQKVIEEAPAPGMTAALRQAMGTAAVAAAKAVGYVGAGTVEFIADASEGLRADRFWFMEMNTRLQVEHPVTEAVTGLDLVEWQFRIAAGEDLPLAQKEVPLAGHAVEARLYAEDPEHGFLPSTGRIIAFDVPASAGVRVDSGVEAGATVTPFYDPLLAKIIAHAPTRDAALDRLRDALAHAQVAGPRTNLAFLAALCGAPSFRAGAFDTGFIDRNLAPLGAVLQPLDKAAAARGIARLLARERERMARRDGETADASASPWSARDGFQLGGRRSAKRQALADGHTVTAEVTFAGQAMSVTVDGVPEAADASCFDADGPSAPGEGDVVVLRHGRQTIVRPREAAAATVDHGDAAGLVTAPMHGKVLALLVEPGQTVVRGERVAIIEAMKMEHTLKAPCDGVVVEVDAPAGSQVAEGARVILIEPNAQDQP